MRRLAVLSSIIVIALWAEGAMGQVKLEITAPSEKASVPQRPVVEGTVSDPSATIWVVVHPMEVSDYWVQPPVTVRRDGSWKVQIHIGRPGGVDVGKTFEIRAVAFPNDYIREGKILSNWPKARATSDVIDVTRK